MKTSLLLLALSLAVAAPLAASRLPAPATPPAGLAVSQVAPTIHLGTVRVEVAARLGSPNAVLPDGTWLYRRYKATDEAERTVATGTLVICFERNRVIAMSLATEPEVFALRAATSRTPATVVARQ